MTTVLLAGDSLAVGLTSPLRALAQSRGLDFVADGRSGTTARQWVGNGWFADDIHSVQPDIVLVSLGTNDMRADQSNLGDDLATMRAVAAGRSLRWIAPPRMPFDEGTVRASIAALGVPVFHSESHDYVRAADGVHMPPSGYAAWAQDIASAGFLDPGGVSLDKKKLIAVGGAVVLVAWAAGWLD